MQQAAHRILDIKFNGAKCKVVERLAGFTTYEIELPNDGYELPSSAYKRFSRSNLERIVNKEGTDKLRIRIEDSRFTEFTGIVEGAKLGSGK